MQYPAKLVLDGKAIENAFPDWYDILKNDRVEHVESETVWAANERAKRAKAMAPRQFNRIYGHCIGYLLSIKQAILPSISKTAMHIIMK